MKNIFKASWQERMKAAGERLCVNMFGVFSCESGCFRIVEISFEHNDLERDGNRSHLAVWLRPVGGHATDHMGRTGWANNRNNWHAIKMRDFLKFYQEV